MRLMFVVKAEPLADADARAESIGIYLRGDLVILQAAPQRLTKTSSAQRARPCMLIRTPAASSGSVDAMLLNCAL
jgi:hypothetical protein